MRNLDFKYAAGWNFMPFGPDGIELDLKKYGNIVLIQGENRDAKAIDPILSTDESKISSNGSGKSSLQELIVWTLYGKTIKRPEKIGITDVIHNLVGKDCRTIVEFDNYRVERIRHGKSKAAKHSLRLWQSDQGIWDKTTEITAGTEAITQKEINKRVGLSYDAFVNICIFTDDQRSCFLECSTDIKLEIVENLMQLGVYRDWFETAKELKKEINSKIEVKTKEYSLLSSNKDSIIRRVESTEKKLKDWADLKSQEKTIIENKIIDKTQQLGKTDNGQAIVLYQEAQEKIAAVNLKIPDLDAAREKIVERLSLVKDKDVLLKKDAQEISEIFYKYSRESKSFLEDRKKKESEIADLESEVPGTRCGKCKGVVEVQNIEKYIFDLKTEISSINLDILARKLSSEEIGAKVEEIKVNQTKLKQLEIQTEQKRTTIDNELAKLRADLTAASQVREPKADSSEFLLQQQIEELNRQLEEKKKEIAGKTPYDDLLSDDNLELNNLITVVENKEKEIKLHESEIAHFNYWIHGFGPNGIRKWVIDGIIPDLNARINYWLQFLIDNMITLKFDNQLNETIERNPTDGDPYIYYAMSTGQRRRLNLAVGHSFAYVTELSADAIPSIIFLDEVTTNVDPLGVQGIYNMISELAEDKQVFVTTHDPDLVRMLQGASVIKLIHENGYTKKV